MTQTPIALRKLADVCSEIDVWGDWRTNYGKYVPRFIQEAARGGNWSEWDNDVFHEYFNRSSNQCVSSLKQGYFNNEEKDSIKSHWSELAPLLQKIAVQQNAPQFEIYEEIKSTIRKYTHSDKRAATNRLIAGLQPQLLSTIVNKWMLDDLIAKLKQRVPEFEFVSKASWFETSYEVLQIFKQALGTDDGFSIITYPWQVYEEYDFNNSKGNLGNDMSESKYLETLAVLRHKKQIILQGPPGTGKTRLAKQIAGEMNTLDFNVQDMNRIRQSEVFHTLTDRTPFTVEEVDEKGGFFRVRSSQASRSYTVQFELVLNCINAFGWRQGAAKWNQNGNGQYVISLALEISHRKLEEADAENVKIIQFHPSYTYEDFVRGIISKPNPDGDGIMYEAENKVLATMAKAAAENYYLSALEVDSPVLHSESMQSRLSQFIDHVIGAIDVEGKYMISSNVYIFYVDDTRFKYKGDNWEAHSKGLNMNFSELEKIIEAGVSERADINKLTSLNSLTRSHATYYANVIERYNTFLADHSLNISKEPTSLKNYVLIIDEINRANLSSVLGELIYALEYRGEAVESMYEVNGSNKLTLPPNLYIIGTVNTADRSVGHIDYAIRRRFAFVDVLPERLQEDEEIYFNEVGFDKVSALFTSKNVSPEFEIKDVQLGHSYFIAKKEETVADQRDEIFRIKMEYEVVPILQEYVKDGILVNSFGSLDIKDYIDTLKSAV